MTKKIRCKFFSHFHQFFHTGTRADPEICPITNFMILPFCILCAARTDPEFCLTTNTILSGQFVQLTLGKRIYNYEQ